MDNVSKNERRAQADIDLIEQLQGSEAQYRKLSNNLHEIIFTIDLNGKLVYLNPAWQICLGFEISDCIGKPLVNFVADADKSRFNDLMLSGWLNVPVKLNLYTKYREIRTLQFFASMTDANDHSGNTTGLLVDITEAEEESSKLRANKECFELIVRASNDGVWDWNMVTDKAYFSDRWKSMLGFAPEDIDDGIIEWSSRVHPEDISIALAALNRHLRGDVSHYECILRMQHKDGSWRWILTRGISTKNANGIALRMAGSHTDLTALKLAEETLKLREQEQKAIIDICPDGILSISETGSVNFVNAAFIAISGIAAEYLIGLSTPMLWEKLLDSFSVDGKFSLDDLNTFKSTEIILKAKTSLKAIKLISRTQDGDAMQKLLYLRDITVESEVDRMKSEFLSNAAHELRTPMTIIYGFTELLMSKDFGKKMQLDIIQTIHNQAKNLTHIINDLLDIARIESRKGEDFVMLTQSIQPILLEVKKEWDGLADANRINFHVSAEMQLVLVDKDKIKQTISNVLSNACKYSSAESSIDVNVVYKKNTENMFIGIQVIDHGDGMTQEQLSHLFERFWRANASGDVSGTGLGMTIIKEIIETHQGHIEVQSEHQKGTTVTLWLPAAHAHEATIASL